MKKRQIPIPLIIAFVLLCCIGAFINFKAQPTTSEDAKAAAAPPPPVQSEALGAPRAPTSKDSLISQVNVGSKTDNDPAIPSKAHALQVGNGPTMPPGGPPGGPPGMPPGMRGPNGMPRVPTKPPKPKPNDASISGQWYSPDANQNVDNKG